MTPPLTSSITGIEEVDRQLASLASGATRIAERATLAAAKPIKAAIKAATPRGKTGLLQRSVGRRRLKKTQEGSRGAKVGFNVARRSAKTRAPHAPLVTLGTAERWTGSKSRAPKARTKFGIRQGMQTGNARAYRGRMTPQEIVPRAVASSQAQSEAEMRRVALEEIAKVTQ